MAEFTESLHPRGFGGKFRKILDQVASSKSAYLMDAKKRGEYPNPAKAAELQHYVDNGTVSVRMFPHQFNSMLDDGRFKTMHEVGFTNGMHDPNKKQFEQNLWGAHPTYGYVAPKAQDGTTGGHYDHAVSMYGPVKVELKDHMKQRSTVTDGDSWVGIPHPSPATEIDPATTSYKPDSPVLHHPYGQWEGSYVEAQVFGGVKPEDIKHVSFATGYPNEMLREKMRKHGITYSVDPRHEHIEAEHATYDPDFLSEDENEWYKWHDPEYTG